MEYLHRPRESSGFSKRKNTLHLDLKGENVLIDEDLHVKICDFGLSTMSTLTKLQSQKTVHSGPIEGTLAFIAPERFAYPPCRPNTKCDVYAFGILQYTILTDLPPYEDLDKALLEHHVAKNGLRPETSKVSTAYPGELIQMMTKCWDPVPDNRPSFNDLRRIMDDIRENVRDFDAKVTTAMNAIVDILDQLKIPHKISSESRFATAREISHRSQTTAVSSPPIDAGNENEETCPKTPVFSQVNCLAHRMEIEHRDDEDNNFAQYDIPDVNINENQYGGDFPSKTSILKRLITVGNPGAQDERIQLLPGNVSPIIDMEAPWCSTTKILLGVSVAVLFVAAVTIGVMIPVLHKSNDSQGKGAACPPVIKPNHGDVICSVATHNTAAKCRFLCDEGYSIFGSESVLCTAGKWSTKQPTCERACKSLTITNGELKCTNKTFEDSVCTVTCNKPHVIHGVSSITCQRNRSWSSRAPSCVCPICTIGDKCEFSTSWVGVSNTLLAMQAYSSIKVDYGGKMFICTSELHSIKVLWTGKCFDKDTGIQTECSNDHESPRSSAIAAAASLIRELVVKQIYPVPCDADKMPSSADC